MLHTTHTTFNEGISVLMPVYNQGAFISRAVASLRLQTYINWELIIINDGSTDYTAQVIEEFVDDARIKCFNNETNEGIGFSINKALALAKFDLIAYLPADDIYFKDHLSSLAQTVSTPGVVAAYSGVIHHYLDLASSSTPLQTEGVIDGETIQLVQILHRKTADKWLERAELVTDNLNTMYWTNLGKYGAFAYSGHITCEWVDHPAQHHKITRETLGGGIYLYKQYYNVNHPIKYKTSVGNLIDETESFKLFRNQPLPETDQSLKILLVGELAYNPERIIALEEMGHKLYAVWINSPANYTTTGPLPFGNVTTIAEEDLVAEVQKIKPDVIYALLNQQAVPLANYVLRAQLGIPFIWHFKEGPFVCRQNGIWNMLIELYTNADGRIFINQENREWFAQFIADDESKTFILDGDLPKREWFAGERTALLSDIDGEPHTLVAGRPYGITADDVKALVSQGVHLHFYGDIQHTYWKNFIAAYPEFASGYLHIHSQCDQRDWVKEFSQYDAAWLHLFDSQNNKEYMRAIWPDLNYPARLSTHAAAGLPMIMKNNAGHIVASQHLIQKLDIGICFDTINDIGTLLRNKHRMQQLRANVEKHKMTFCFDHHAPELVSFFRQTIARCKQRNAQGELVTEFYQHN
jgi:glycosyltransferase involved in cell wall biosynthesis